MNSFIQFPAITAGDQESYNVHIENLFLELQDGDFEHDNLEEFLNIGKKTIPLLLKQLENQDKLMRQMALDLLGRIDLKDDGILNRKKVVNSMQYIIIGWEDKQIEVIRRCVIL